MFRGAAGILRTSHTCSSCRDDRTSTKRDGTRSEENVCDLLGVSFFFQLVFVRQRWGFVGAPALGIPDRRRLRDLEMTMFRDVPRCSEMFRDAPRWRSDDVPRWRLWWNSSLALRLPFGRNGVRLTSGIKEYRALEIRPKNGLVRQLALRLPFARNGVRLTSGIKEHRALGIGPKNRLVRQLAFFSSEEMFRVS